MFGTLRFVLSLMVVLSHLAGSDYFVHFGFYAVCGFFVVSGFLMTSGLHEVYRFDGRRFWANRLLRLLPPYYLVCLLTLLAVIQFPTEAGVYLSSWTSDSPGLGAMLNMLVIPLQYAETEFRLVPPYWSVAVELQLYALLFLVAARNEGAALATLWIGLLYHFVCLNGDFGFGARYFAAPSATLCFAVGALIYFWMRRGALEVSPGATALACAMLLANTVAAKWMLPADYAHGPGYYLTTFLFVIVVAGLAKAAAAPSIARIDRALGEIAYPIFLVQWLAGFITALIIGLDQWRGWTLVLASFPLTLGMAIMLTLLSARYVEPLRLRFRPAYGPASLHAPPLRAAAV